jgi:hypothetical protein
MNQGTKQTAPQGLKIRDIQGRSGAGISGALSKLIHAPFQDLSIRPIESKGGV